MNKYHLPCGRRRWAVACLFAAMAVVAAGCGAKQSAVPPDPSLADQFLMTRGREALEKKRWIEAREYFREVIDNYSGSPLRSAAKLALADSYLGEGSTEALVLGANEYREFLTFYPRDEQAPQAQYNLALTYFNQMRAPDRDITATKEALAEFDIFFQRYPDSPLTPEVQGKWRSARERLSDASLDGGFHYHKRTWFPGASAGCTESRRDDPGYCGFDRVYS
jgi:outer membrane protein assembly factor BamD